MVKYAKGEEKPFDPISNKVLSSIASPVVSPSEEASPPAPLQADQPSEKASGSEPAPPKRAPERFRVVNGKRSAPKRRVPVTSKNERLSRPVKCLFTPSEEQELRAFIDRLGAEAKFSLTLSHLMRPYFELLLHSEEQLTNELRRAGLTRPINEKTAIALFESVMAEVIHCALRKAPPFRTERRESER